MSEILSVGNTYKDKSIKLNSNAYYSKCKFINCPVSSDNFLIKDLCFSSCTFYNCTLADMAAVKNKIVDCMFYSTKFEYVSLAEMLLSNNTFYGGTFKNITLYKNDLFNCVFSESKDVIKFKMNSCTIVGGSIPPTFIDKLDLIATQFKTISDVFQSPDVQSTVPDYLLDTKETYVPVNSKKPHVFISEGI